MRAARPELHAVVEIGRALDNWLPLPPEPWPDFVRLCGATPSQDVALVVAVVASYGGASDSPAPSIQEVLDEFPEILRGGIAVVAGERSILPGCCCGLETWHEWREIVSTGRRPWMGHDPAPFVEVVEDQIRVWPDGGLGDQPADQDPIVLSRAEFVLALERVSQDLEAFLVPLRGWLDQHLPRQAAEFVMCFQRAFVREPVDRR